MLCYAVLCCARPCRPPHLLVLVLPVLLPHEVDECVVDAATMGQEEGATGGQVVEKEQVLLHTHVAVVTLLGLLYAWV